MLNELVRKLEMLGDRSNLEQEVKEHVVIPLLEALGYNKDDFHFEHALCRKGQKDAHADIFIPIEEKGAMFVETKKATKDLDDEDIEQLIVYMSLHNELTWGILTNGRQIFLVNKNIIIAENDITKTNAYKVVLNVEYDIKTKKFTNAEYIKYFSKESIFDTNIILYFKAVAQFIAIHKIKKVSEEKYRHTLWGFFDYYISKGNDKVIIGGREYSPLEYVRDIDYIDFLKTFVSSTRSASGNVPLHKISHMTAMYSVMEENGYINNNTMKALRERAIQTYDTVKEKTDPKTILTDESIESILLQFKDKPYKVIIFTLAAYYGWERKKIVSFLNSSWDCIDFENNTFVLDNKKYPMVNLMRLNLQLLNEKYKKDGLRKPKAIYVFKKNNKYTSARENSVIQVFKDIKDYDNKNVNSQLFNAQNVRRSAIYNMFCNGCSIEEIVYITDSNIKKMAEYLPDELVLKNGEKKWRSVKKGSKDKHPFKKFFDE